MAKKKNKYQRLKAMSYSEYLKTNYWQNIRKKILHRDGHEYIICNASENLQVLRKCFLLDFYFSILHTETMKDKITKDKAKSVSVWSCDENGKEDIVEFTTIGMLEINPDRTLTITQMSYEELKNKYPNERY